LDAAGSSMRICSTFAFTFRVIWKFEDIAPILTQYLGESRPALTGIGVASLASPETLVEVEATAQVISLP